MCHWILKNLLFCLNMYAAHVGFIQGEFLSWNFELSQELHTVLKNIHNKNFLFWRGKRDPAVTFQTGITENFRNLNLYYIVTCFRTCSLFYWPTVIKRFLAGSLSGKLGLYCMAGNWVGIVWVDSWPDRVKSKTGRIIVRENCKNSNATIKNVASLRTFSCP